MTLIIYIKSQDCEYGFYFNGTNCNDCGITYFSPNVRIVGGVEAVQNSWPAQVLVVGYVEDSTSFYAYCGGTIINPYTILTAAHCYVDIYRDDLYFIVYAGAHNITSILNKVTDMPILTLSCGHKFELDYLNKWFSSQNTKCPTCNFEISSRRQLEILKETLKYYKDKNTLSVVSRQYMVELNKTKDHPQQIALHSSIKFDKYQPKPALIITKESNVYNNDPPAKNINLGGNSDFVFRSMTDTSKDSNVKLEFNKINKIQSELNNKKDVGVNQKVIDTQENKKELKIEPVKQKLIDQPSFILSCGHTFSLDYLDKWFNKQNTVCPACDFEISSRRQRDVKDAILKNSKEKSLRVSFNLEPLENLKNQLEILLVRKNIYCVCAAFVKIAITI